LSGWWFWKSKKVEQPSEEELARVVDELAEKLCRRDQIDWDAYVLRTGLDELALRQLVGAMAILVDFGASERDAG